MKKGERTEKNPSADKTDVRILSLLREDARMSIRHIAEKTFLSPTAISARIEKLEKDGYIEGYYTRINPQAFGFNIKAFINLEVEPVQKKEFLSLYPQLPQRRGVQLRDGGLRDAHRSAFPHDGGARSFHQRIAAFREDKDADRLFHLRRTPGRVSGARMTSFPFAVRVAAIL